MAVEEAIKAGEYHILWSWNGQITVTVGINGTNFSKHIGGYADPRSAAKRLENPDAALRWWQQAYHKI